jgi:hypothetical protein
MAATPIAVSPTGGNDDPGESGPDGPGEAEEAGEAEGSGEAEGVIDSPVPRRLALRARIEEGVEVLVRPEFTVAHEREDLGPAGGVARE